MVQLTLLVMATSYHQGEADQTPEGHERALGVVRDPESLLAVHTVHAPRGQAHFSACRGASFSSGHLLDPPLGNYSATFLRKRFRSSLRVESTSSTLAGDTRPVSPI